MSRRAVLEAAKAELLALRDLFSHNKDRCERIDGIISALGLDVLPRAPKTEG